MITRVHRRREERIKRLVEDIDDLYFDHTGVRVESETLFNRVATLIRKELEPDDE